MRQYPGISVSISKFDAVLRIRNSHYSYRVNTRARLAHFDECRSMRSTGHVTKSKKLSHMSTGHMQVMTIRTDLNDAGNVNDIGKLEVSSTLYWLYCSNMNSLDKLT